MTINLTANAGATGSTLPLGTGATGTQAKTLPSADAASEAAHPFLKVTAKKKIPNGVASNAKQHALFVLDRSGSMGGSKIAELEMAMTSILALLGDEANKDGFRVTIIPFNHDKHVHCSAVPVASVPPVNLTADGGTDFNAPLREVIAQIDRLKAQPNPDGWHYLLPQVLFLSDGRAQVDEGIIRDLHERANVTAVAYGSDADQATLARIASDGQVHVVGTNGGALREFLAAVGDTLVTTIKAAM